MLGCFVGPAEAARGVPERFTGMALNGEVPSTPTPAATRAAPPEPMEIDKT
jgi:vacuolar protein sorting-associated protein 72